MNDRPETRPDFHGRDYTYTDRPQHVLVSAGEWAAFTDACRAAGVARDFGTWAAWRLGQPPFPR